MKYEHYVVHSTGIGIGFSIFLGAGSFWFKIILGKHHYVWSSE